MILLTTDTSPRRGEIWLVNLDPTIGAEMRKTRPAVVLSTDNIRSLPLRLVAPITGWKGWYTESFWHVRLAPDSDNGLTKLSAVDTLQLRSVDVHRLGKRIGFVNVPLMEVIAATVAAVVEHQ